MAALFLVQMAAFEQPFEQPFEQLQLNSHSLHLLPFAALLEVQQNEYLRRLHCRASIC